MFECQPKLMVCNASNASFMTPSLSVRLNRSVWAARRRNDRHSGVGVERLGSYSRIDITRRAYDTLVALQFLLIGAIVKRRRNLLGNLWLCW
jgi:hypothetical protein